MRRLGVPRIVLAASLLLSAVGTAFAAPRVVATITPVHSLVAAVMEGVGEPHLLLRGGASPHDYVLRPSDRRALADAQVLFWVGEGMESFLPRIIGQLDKSVRIVELAELPGVIRLPQRSGGIWADHPAHEAHAKEDTHGHDAPNYNAHLWLDPHNASRWAQVMIETLSSVDPAGADRYRDNGARLQARLEALDAELREMLEPVRATPYVVFHDAYHYLEERYSLTAVGSISLGDGVTPGARRLRELRALLEARGAPCVFAEPQFPARILATLAEGTAVRTGVLDPLGAQLEPGPDLYFELMWQLARNLVACLKP